MQPNRLLAILALTICIASCNEAAKEQNTAAESTAKSADAEKIEVVKRFYPLFEKGDWASIDKLIAANIVDHNPWAPPAGMTNRDSLLIGMKDFHAAFPDMKYEIQSTAVDNDIVFVHYRFTGSNNGPFMGMPATNKKVDFTGVDMVRVKDSVLTEHWDYGDNVTYMKQMGLMP